MKAAVYLSTLGCRLNEAELVSWTAAFESNGHRLVAQVEDANLIVLNTCAVTAEASRKSRKLAGSLHRKNPSAKLVITGCMAELEPERAASLAGVDLVIGNREKDELVEQVLQKIDLETMPTAATSPDSVHVYPGGQEPDSAGEVQSLIQLGKATNRTRAFIKVQDGCRNQCTYCVVTIARGEERSRTIDALVAEIEALHQKGYREAVLTGVHLGGYGYDLGTTLSELVRAVLSRTGMERIRLSSLEPWDLPEDFGELWQEARLMPHLHLPLQSGSDPVLRRMARRCFTKDYRHLVESLRNHIPDLNLTTDLIVGFPGETDAEFQQSLDFVEEIGFGHMHIFGFSPREGTKAAKLSGRIQGPLIRERSREMHRLATRMKESAMAQFLGTQRPVLWEGTGKPSDNGQVRYRGYTDNYLSVETYVEKSQRLQDTITMVELLAADDESSDRFRGRILA
ncbi:MAG: tRNA (N(6)-L-threonylcarbamoyladenosine(37)-C(2))-methylthiotransferase MtaB [Kofleriaceae bacterium]|nr:tRNA (N(6)-L-threonylcarbamoyladenosine(37)-C(2))-methylthiotransferase MtaB [Kofleriaceae bacterium]